MSNCGGEAGNEGEQPGHALETAVVEDVAGVVDAPPFVEW